MIYEDFTKENEKMSKRLHIIDEYRGLVVLNMVLYHAIWDLVFMFGNDWYWFIEERQGWRIWIGGSFILISGFCWQMSRNPMKRGLLVYLCGVIVSAVTLLFTPDAKIIFGVLTLLGSSMLLMIPFDLVFQKIHPIIGIVVSVAVFFLTFGVNKGYFGFGEVKLMDVPEEWYANGFTTYLGFPESGFFSADYYTIFPWFFLFMTGYFLYSLYAKYKTKKVEKVLKASICPPLGWVGRHALIIYMIHQPVIYGGLLLLQKVLEL